MNESFLQIESTQVRTAKLSFVRCFRVVRLNIACLVCLLSFTGCAQSTEPAEDKTQTTHEKEGHAHSKRKTPNKLGGETSPYLLTHAYNPVDWYPWNEESLAKAKKENKPIFLSIGYSSCHWCHVMERESFMDEEIAKYMNEHFVCIKVDREERPDIDNIYMTSLHAFNRLTGSGGGGGWPLSMFMTPEGLPFFGGTYFPARDGDRGENSTGFFTLLKGVENAWNNKNEQIRKDAEVVTRHTRQELEGVAISKTVTLDSGWTDLLTEQLQKSFDTNYGGFTNMRSPNRPKFPEPSNLFFLIDRIQNHSAETTDESRKMLTKTLDYMARGGIWDHVGGGFHRYSVDRFWHIPHYEKMLYDNGQLATTYAEAYALTKREDYREVVNGICQFVITEMTAPEKAYYSALDADSEGEEGKFYVWTREEIKEALDETEYKLFADAYQIDETPNFEGKFYSPQYADSLLATAKRMEMEPRELDAALVPLRAKLKKIRSKRERPLTDTKILTSWNGMMIRGMADAGRILEKDTYLSSAKSAADFILNNMVAEDGRLYRTYAEGKAKLNAYLNDYAFMIDGLIALHRATSEQKWLDAALELQAQQDRLFWDEKNGGYFFTSVDHEILLARSKIVSDGAQPAGSSVSAVNLIQLSKLTQDSKLQAEFKSKSIGTVKSISGILVHSPRVAPRMMIAVRQLTEKD